MRRVILTLLLTVVSSSEAAEWIQQPSSFVGIAIGQPLSASVPEMCEQFKAPPGKLCFDNRNSGEGKFGPRPKHKDYFDVRGIEIPPLGQTIKVITSDDTLDGTVEHLQTGFLSSSFFRVMEMLTIKYGSPHKNEVEKFKTQGGAEFDNIVLSWYGNKVLIKVESLANRKYIGGSLIESGTIVVVTTEFLTKKTQESNEAAKKGAAGL